MLYRLIDEAKQWNNKCPKCNSRIRWSLTSGRAGASASAYCSNNIIASRIHISPRRMKICSWNGKAVRQKDGGIRFINDNGAYLAE